MSGTIETPHYAAQNLLDATTTNPCRRAFGFSHTIVSVPISILSPIALPYAIIVSTPGYQTNIAAQIATLALAVSTAATGILGAAFRRANRSRYLPERDVYSAIAVEFAHYAAKQPENSRRAVWRSLVAGAKNGLVENGVVYLGKTAACASVLLTASASSAVKFTADIGKSLYLESQGKDPSIATRKTFSDYMEDWEPIFDRIARPTNRIAATESVAKIIAERRNSLAAPVVSG